tara:strand:- start:3381 stop:4961 length:1581 start_codon:yes stop_codon:yes gene_type:complete
MEEIEIVGQVIGGKIGDILIREKSGKNLEIGDLLVSEEENSFLILQTFALEYGSQIEERMQQMMSGVNLEQDVKDAEFYEPEFVNYVLARIKALARVSKNDFKPTMPKSLPSFFNKLRLIKNEDLKFLKKEKEQVFIGNIRSGSKVIKEAEVWLPAVDVFSHHVLIPATTGRGKSNLVKTILWHLLDHNKVGALVLDAHDEYYGRNEPGLKEHFKSRDNLAYYTPANPPVGCNQLTINLQSVRPEHFEGIARFSEPQYQFVRFMYGRGGIINPDWIRQVLTVDPEEFAEIDRSFQPGSIAVAQRKLKLLLGIDVAEGGEIISRNGVFDGTTRGMQTVNDIANVVEEGKIAVLDTSRLGSDAELLVGNIIASQLFENYKRYKSEGRLSEKPVVSVIIEEAPRVIGEDAMEAKNDNIYSLIAKEGRKFKIGLTAITQLASVIPKTILANMNTKIILGNEMKYERQAIIESASQDLSDDDRNIASLDKGEAIISSIFVPFAMPIKVPLFDELIQKQGDISEKKTKTKVF